MTESDRTLHFDDICDLFVELSAHNPPAELHGMLTGQLCTGMRMSPEVWIGKALTFMDTDQMPAAAAQRELKEVYEFTYAQLEDPNNTFYPLLPDDDEEVSSRIRALGQWCEGFLAGFALVEQASERQFPVVVSDALKDLAAITKAGADADEELSDECEEDYAEVVEYVRILAMNIYLECGCQGQEPVDQAKGASSTQQLFNKPLH